MSGPPPKETGALLHAPKAPEPTEAYHVSLVVQAQWQLEASRLFREYWRTGNPKHLAAFVRHVVAMRLYEKAATP